MSVSDQKVNFDNQPYARFIGIEFVHSENGFARLKLLVKNQHLTMMQTVHGGILATIADAACAQALMPMLTDDEIFTSIELKTNYLSPGRLNEVLIGEGRILQRGGRIAVGDMEVRDEASNRIVLKGLHTFMISKRKA